MSRLALQSYSASPGTALAITLAVRETHILNWGQADRMFLS
jgi:hypothetical protein